MGLQPRERQVRARETQARFIRAIGRRDESRPRRVAPNGASAQVK
nr:MAG TPA: hypothetical protein [Caudoviricetes sp.]